MGKDPGLTFTTKGCHLLAIWLLATCVASNNVNEPPIFEPGGFPLGLPLSEATEVGTKIATLKGHDPEGSPVKYGIQPTDKFTVDPVSGVITLAKPLDREENDTVRFLVSLEDQVTEGQQPNIVGVDAYVIILDVNDNPPKFSGTPYEAMADEDTPIGTTILPGIRVTDPDLIGGNIELSCVSQLQFPDACAKFGIVDVEKSENTYVGALVLREPLDYKQRPFYQLLLRASDGTNVETTGVEIKVADIQNSPPEFLDSLTGIVKENDSIGTLVMTVKARDGDRGMPRQIVYELETNPFDYFLLDRESGELRTAKPLDREALEDSTGVLTLKIKAREVVNGIPGNDESTVSTANATVTIKDVNDEPPTFNKREYNIEIPENVPDGTLLPHLDMTVKDPDVGFNSEFSLRLEDITGAFTVEPSVATGSTSVNIRVSNGSLDYENPNQQKFIILVIAEELHTNPKLSSTATVTVTITDANDNAPSFSSPTYTAVVSETSPPGTPVATIRAKDRDSGRFGTAGIVYQLLGQGAEHFAVDKRNGSIAVAPCPSPGASPCLDFEEQNEYFLNYKAIDDDGNGQTTTVSLRISLADANDSPPKFLQEKYRAVVDEGADKFEPELKVQARDRDKTSKITYSIIDGNELGFFEIHPSTGEIRVTNNGPVDLTNSTHDWISLTVSATDGLFSDTAIVNVTVRDVNNNEPIFLHEVYTASVPETASPGTEVEELYATDADSGVNAELKYRIQKGAFDDFVINETTGMISVSGNLDYDTRNVYNIEVIALDGGIPSLSGTTTLMIKIENTNNKAPYFTPNTQRAEVTEDSPVGTVFTSLKAVDPDSTTQDALRFSITEPITAIDKNGQLVSSNITSFKDFFAIDPKTGQVSVVRPLDRETAATVSLNVIVTDTSASGVQQGTGTLVITIIDVNHLPPEFLKPWTKENPKYPIEMQEEQPTGAIVGAFTATDVDSNISGYAIDPPSPYFNIDNVTGIVRTSQVIDYEETKQLEFTVVAYDSGVPQLSSTAKITVNIINVNDQDPKFQQQSYNVTVKENAPPGTHVTVVKAIDGDEGAFGEVSYSLIGEHASDFNIGHETGEITVGVATVLDREERSEITVTVMASDNAPVNSRRTTTVPVVIHLEDVNDNKPLFTQHSYRASVAENLSINPPATILQVRAEDNDEGLNGKVSYTIVSGNDDGAFNLNGDSGFLYPAISLVGRSGNYRIEVEARDGGGKGPHSDRAFVDIRVIPVNQHKPEFVMPELANATVEVPENSGVPNYLVMTVRAIDEDSGENGRINYYLKVGNRNVPETDEFVIDQETGELRAKIILDREVKSKFELVLVATDHGNPTNYESLRLLTILLVDTNDNVPEFYEEYNFQVPENRPKDYVVGRVAAEDKDEGRHARVYYYIAGGNDNSSFYIDKSDGTIYANRTFDRETRDSYVLSILAANDPDLYVSSSDADKSVILNPEHGHVNVTITILDENDSPPVFERSDYYTGINSMANVNDIVAKVNAYDQDLGENGTLYYYVASANLYKYGSDKPSGSIVPSPFNVSQDGKLRTSGYMAEYNQDRFIVEIVAKETASPERFAMARVHVWVFEPSQLIRVILSRPPDEVHRQRDEIVSELSNATQSRVVVDEIRYHVDSAGKIRREWCDMYLHVVDPKNQNITPVPQVLRAIDAKYDVLKDYYIGFAIENVVPAFAGRQEAPFDPALAALIALLVVLLVGAVTVTVVCCCLRHWVITVPSDIRKKDGLIKKQIIDELNTTENPLWIEQKLKLYEEQELTMQVFSEPEGGLITERRGSGGSVGMDTSQDNTYATIQHPTPANRHRPTTPDYTTLPGNHSLYESAMGFQGSTFQPSTTVVPQLTLDRDGQPQFVSGLV
ncbi:cadherin-87A isoform X2 [Diachasmimorpha longicaudata]|uniref:cadherin-87A isoform X2 n=1 Tax=Diachasmimorpha longicaudata TaxID=58733 RepID=UPI0030B8D4DA